MKAAFLVTLCPMTRVVIEVSDPKNLNEQEEETLITKAREQILANAEEKLNCENILEVKLDKECPYGTFDDEENK